jgi:hypothetical protein
MAVCYRDPGKEVELKITGLQTVHFTVAAWEQVVWSIIEIVCQYGYGCECAPNVQHWRRDWWFPLGLHSAWCWEYVDFSSRTFVDIELAMCRTSSTSDLCAGHKGPEGGGLGWRRHEFESALSVTKLHTAFTLLSHSFTCTTLVSRMFWT